MTATILLFLAVFGACAVEATEALTLVLAASTKGLRPALKGAACALVILAVGGATVGAPVVAYVPLNALRVVLGLGALYVGATWLRKAILRSSGRKAKHDEDAIYAEATSRTLIGPFALAFQAVLVEGFEVILIVLTIGPASHHLGVAALAAMAAVMTVTLAGVIIAKPLRKVPENTIKLFVSILLLSMGTFFLGEGLGLAWPGSDAMILALAATFGTTAALAIRSLRIPEVVKA
jgi:uncharacterized membrane protein